MWALGSGKARVTEALAVEESGDGDVIVKAKFVMRVQARRAEGGNAKPRNFTAALDAALANDAATD